MLATILLKYGMQPGLCEITTIGSGLINLTWKITFQNSHYILQKINNAVFRTPKDIDDNINLLNTYLKKQYPSYLFVAPVKSLTGETLINLEADGFFRLFPFVNDSKTTVLSQNKKQAFEASRQFGRFTRLLSRFPLEKLKTVIPDFHNLSLRYQQLEKAISTATEERLRIARMEIDHLLHLRDIATHYDKIVQQGILKTRVIHYDTKISNVLFNQHDEGLCVIDLDTVMRGYFISDVGDMIRTYACTVTEEEEDVNKVNIREDYFEAIITGYLYEMRGELEQAEIEHMVYAGKFMIYMQAVRFMTDYLNNDIYYGAKYDTHNFVRARNQMTLLDAFIKKENILKKLVGNAIQKSFTIDNALGDTMDTFIDRTSNFTSNTTFNNSNS